MELVVVSGKGGTGKTMIASSLVHLNSGDPVDSNVSTVMADCDVDAPNLYLYCKGIDIRRDGFSATKKAEIDEHLCVECGLCAKTCQFGAVREDCTIDETRCEGCGACVLACPSEAIRLTEHKDADVYLTRTTAGMLSRAKMAVGSDGSGKLITTLRANARDQLDGNDLVIIDGSPGIGCPVISSIAGADVALLVTEPTLSGLEDLKRIIQLCERFWIPMVVCVNKHDLNVELSESIEGYCRDQGVEVVGKIPFDDTVTESINSLRPITAYPQSPAGAAVLEMWEKIKRSRAWRQVTTLLEKENRP